MIKWRIYYSDGEVCSGYDEPPRLCTPEEAPPFGVIAIVQACPDEGMHVVAQHDYYWCDKVAGRWVGGDFIGLIDALAQCKGPVKFGRMMPSAKKFEEIMAKANSDPDFVKGGTWRMDGANAGTP